MDETSTSLKQICLDGRVIAQMQVEHKVSESKTSTTYLQYDLKNATIVSCDTGESVEGRTPIEEFSVRYETRTVSRAKYPKK